MKKIDIEKLLARENRQLEKIKEQYALKKRSYEKTGFNSRRMNSELFHNQKNAQLKSLEIAFGSKNDIDIKISQVKAITGVKNYNSAKKLKDLYLSRARKYLHGNQNRMPHNRISDQNMKDACHIIYHILELVNKHHEGNRKEISYTRLKKKALTIKDIYHYVPIFWNKITNDNFRFPFKIDSLYKKIDRGEINITSKYSFKLYRKTRTKIYILNNNIKILEEALQALPHDAFATKMLEENKVVQKIVATKKDKKIHKFKPGEVVHIDGSEDNLYKTNAITRHSLVDEVSGYCYGVAYETQETNKGFMRIIIQMLLLIYPLIIKGDNRKGIEIIKTNGKVGIFLKHLGILVITASDANHKSRLESANGNFHSMTMFEFAMRETKTIEQAQKIENEICFKYNKNHNFHLHRSPKEKLVPKKILEFASNYFIVIFPKRKEGFVYKQQAYKLVDFKGNSVDCPIEGNFLLGTYKGQKTAMIGKELYDVVIAEKLMIKANDLTNNLLKEKKFEGGLFIDSNNINQLMKISMTMAEKAVKHNFNQKGEKIKEEQLINLKKVTYALEQKRIELYNARDELSRIQSKINSLK